MAELSLVRKLPDDWGKGFAELYKQGDRYLVVSTINHNANQYNEADEAIVGMVGMIGGYPISGEETMAFVADEAGEVQSWGEVGFARGAGSRDLVLEDLRADVAA